MPQVMSRGDSRPFTTEDGSVVRELAHPRTSDARRQSLAEATVEPGGETREHKHPLAEEIYSFISGSGLLRVDGEQARVAAQDTVVIPPGTPHKLINDGDEPLVLLCCCAPAYSPEDVVFTE